MFIINGESELFILKILKSFCEGKAKLGESTWLPVKCLIKEVVYYESIKRELKTKPIYECRCDERPNLKAEDMGDDALLNGNLNNNAFFRSRISSVTKIQGSKFSYKREAVLEQTVVAMHQTVGLLLALAASASAYVAPGAMPLAGSRSVRNASA